MKRVSLLVLLTFGLASTGCNDAVSVSGAVQYQGKPVKDGVVQFIPTKGLPVSAELINGDYQIGGDKGLKPGSHAVRLFGYRETGRMLNNPDDPTKLEPEVVELLPPVYNQESRIEVELVAGENSRDFDLD